ncbi:MAG TPA: M20/M25/M40 family metallo-hydrolase [Solirubrobacteraceae bacterium]|nr:M20/M25/M40 family metallo-hydrolase [Solirubrobacteraceae bacterium]
MTDTPMTEALSAATLAPEEQALVEQVAARRDELVALACELISFDTTSRTSPEMPAREEAALQERLAERLRAAGAEVDVWEPVPEDVADHPLTRGRRFAFDGRPQLAARFRGAAGRETRSLMFNGHIDVVPAALEDGWDHDPFDPQVRDGRITGRGACDMKGGIAAMVIAAETLAEDGALSGDLVVCTNTEEESGGAGALACARHGVSADFTIVTEPTGLEVWPACRGSVYAAIAVAGRAGHAEQEHPHWREGGAVNAIEKARHLLAGVDRLRADWRSRAAFRHPLLDPPDIVPVRLSADAGWDVTIPGRAELTLAVLLQPSQADADGWTSSVRQEVEGYLRRWCDTDDWLCEHPPTFSWYVETNPSETPVQADSVQALLGANGALGLPLTLGGLGSWYDGATFALETGSPALMYGPRHIDWAHTVGEYVPIDDLVSCAQALAVAGSRLCRSPRHSA